MQENICDTRPLIKTDKPRLRNMLMEKPQRKAKGGTRGAPGMLDGGEPVSLNQCVEQNPTPLTCQWIASGSDITYKETFVA